MPDDGDPHPAGGHAVLHRVRSLRRAARAEPQPRRDPGPQPVRLPAQPAPGFPNATPNDIRILSNSGYFDGPNDQILPYPFSQQGNGQHTCGPDTLGKVGLSTCFWDNHNFGCGATGGQPTESTTLDSVFPALNNVAPSLANATFQDALDGLKGSHWNSGNSNNGGTLGSIEQLLTEAVASYLNASFLLDPTYHTTVYTLAESQVVAQVDSALSGGSSKTMNSLEAYLDGLNNQGGITLKLPQYEGSCRGWGNSGCGNSGWGNSG